MSTHRVPDSEAIRTRLACGRPSCPCARRGSRTHCPVPGHPDRNPSFDVVERGGRVLLICRANCRQTEVIAALRARDLWPDRSSAARPRRPRSPLDQARSEMLDRARREPGAQPAVSEAYALADTLRIAEQHVVRLRQFATAMGPSEAAWAPLADAALLEAEVRLGDCILEAARV